jgi:hypothetical protein
MAHQSFRQMMLGISFAMLLVPQTKRPILPPDITSLLPAETLLIKQLPVDFDHDGVDEIVLAYAKRVEPNEPRIVAELECSSIGL